MEKPASEEDVGFLNDRCFPAGSDRKLPVAINDLTVSGYPAVPPQITDHVPVNRAPVLTPGFGNGVSHRQVAGAADFLIKEDVFRKALYGTVGTNGKLTQVSGPTVGVKHGREEILILAGGLSDHLASPELEADILDFPTQVNAGKTVADHSLSGVFPRAGGLGIFPISEQASRLRLKS